MRPFVLLSVIIAVFIGSCGTSPHKTSESSYAAGNETPDYTRKVEQNTESEEVKPSGRKLIKEGDIYFETEDLDKTYQLVKKSVAELNGYISKETQQNYDDKNQHTITARIPSNRFDLFMEKISESISELKDKNIRIKDVTEEYLDVEARLETKKRLEGRYRELLKKAQTVEDILKIEKQIGELREEIESVEGRLKYLKNQVAFSTIEIKYYEEVKSSFGFGPRIIKALVKGWKYLLHFLIFLVYLWPFIIITTGVLWFVLRYEKRKKRKD